MGLLLLFHVTQLWNTWHYGVVAAVSHDPAFVGQVTVVWRNWKCVWNTWSYRYVIAGLLHDPDFLEQVPAFGEKGSVAPDIMRMLLLLHMTQLFSDRSLRLGAWWGVSGIPSVPGALQLVRPVSAGREGGSGAGQVHSPPSLPALYHGQGMGQVSASRLWRGAGGFFVQDHTFGKGNRSFHHRHMCKCFHTLSKCSIRLPPYFLNAILLMSSRLYQTCSKPLFKYQATPLEIIYICGVGYGEQGGLILLLTPRIYSRLLVSVALFSVLTSANPPAWKANVATLLSNTFSFIVWVLLSVSVTWTFVWLVVYTLTSANPPA